jgi:LPXTG-motif cell wall-anchored protein
MRRAKPVIVLAGAALLSLLPAITRAQTTTTSTETKTFRVIAVDGNQLVVRLPEGTRELNVPDDFRFMVNGQSMSVHELKPGMSGTATITTRTTTTPVTVTEVKNGTVEQVSGSSILVRTEQGFRMFSEGDLEKRNVKIYKDGQPVKLTDLSRGDHLAATIVTEKPPKVMTQRQVNATLAASGAPGAAATAGSATGSPATGSSATGSPTRSSRSGASSSASAAPSSSAGTGRALPKTASQAPLLALVGALSAMIGLCLTLARRRMLK